MRRELDDLSLSQAAAITLGTFDGLHLGHQALLQRTVEIAREGGLDSLVFTFPQPPQNYLGQRKKLILPLEYKIRLLAEQVDRVVIADFNNVKDMSPGEFSRLLKRKLKAAVVVVGANYRFGRGRSGNLQSLIREGMKLDFQVEALPPVEVDGEIVSSTAVRRAVRAGDIDKAIKFLGYPPLLVGVVVQGEGRGRELGFPTANLSIDDNLGTPDQGIFAAQISYKGKAENGVLYTGYRPTFNGKQKSYEVHILNEVEELYGVELEVHLLKKLRGDLEFDNPLSLQRQIERDVREAQQFFATSPSGELGSV